MCASQGLGQKKDDPSNTANTSLAGEYLYRAGDCLSAISALKTAISANPTLNLRLGACYLETGSNAEAETALLTYLQQFPSDIRAARLLASTYHVSSRDPDALNVWQQYVRRNPDDLAGQVEIGRFYLTSGDKEKAAATFSTVLSKSADHPGALLGSGLLAIADSKLPDATEYLTHATRVAPGASEAFKALGDVYAKQGKCETAIEPYNRAFVLKPADFPTAKGLAKCYMALHKFEDIRRVLQSSTLEEAKDTEATEMVAKALEENPQALAEYLRGVIELNPSNTVARALWAQSLMVSNQVQAAKREYIEILKLQKDHPDPEVAFKLGSIQETEGDVQSAHRNYEIAVSSPATTAAVRLALARTDLELDDLGGAQLQAAKIGAPDNESSEYKILQIRIQMRSANWDAANAIVTELLSRDANNRQYLDFAAQVALKQERYEDEAGYLERLYQAATTDKGVRSRLVRLYVGRPELKRDDRITELLKDFLARQETDPEGYLLLGFFYQRNKDVANTKTYYDLGFSHLPTPTPPSFAWAYVTYAKFLGTSGNMQDALTNLQLALQLIPNDETTLYDLGIIALQLGDIDEVQRAIVKLQGINPKAAADLQGKLPRNGRLPKRGA